MMYLLCKKQHGEGCDYTIGCGMTYEFVEFDGDLAAAAKHFADEIAWPEGREEYFALDPDMDNVIEEAWIAPAEQVFKLDLQALIREHKRSKADKDQEAAREQELRTLAELKAKYPQV